MRRLILNSFAIVDTLLRSSLIFAAVVAISFSTSALAQNSRASSPSDSISADKGSFHEDRSVGSIEEEMRATRAIKYAEKEHRENVDRAREISALGVQLQQGFRLKKTIDRDGVKKLERLEKLTKKLRSEAGGADVDINIQNRFDLAEAVDRLVQLADSLADTVEKTPRRVISATVIDDANVLLELISIIRTHTRTSD